MDKIALLVEKNVLRKALHLACERIADGSQTYEEANTAEGWAERFIEAAKANGRFDVNRQKEAFTPAEYLRDEMRARGWLFSDLLYASCLTLERATGLMDGSFKVTAEDAWDLAKAFGTSPEMWLNLQSQADAARVDPE